MRARAHECAPYQFPQDVCVCDGAFASAVIAAYRQGLAYIGGPPQWLGRGAPPCEAPEVVVGRLVLESAHGARLLCLRYGGAAAAAVGHAAGRCRFRALRLRRSWQVF